MKSMPHKKSVLIIHLDFPRWNMAKSWSYETQLGLDEGLIHQVNLHSLINLRIHNTSLGRFWVKSIRDVIGNRKFDQVWMEVVHSEYPEEFLEFVAGLAPVRIAMMGESLQYDEEDYQYAPVLRVRYEQVKKRLRYFTHALCGDEDDAREISSDGAGLPALWWVVALPKWSIVNSIEEPIYDKASFSGPVYGSRNNFLQHPELSKYMLYLNPLEKRTAYPLIFDSIQTLQAGSLFAFQPLSTYSSRYYVSAIRYVRLRLYRSWIEGLKRGIAVVQLPHFFKAFPGRVYEGMAAGRPVITMSLKNRPQAMQLFEQGKEILFYENDPEELIELIKLMQKDKAYARRVAENAASKMKAFHTIDIRIKQILKWVETGDVPNYH